MVAAPFRCISQTLKLNTSSSYKHCCRCLSSSSSSSSNAIAKRVGTHNGSFHYDEALACFILRLTNSFSNSDQIVRTKDPQVLNKLDAVLDVGGVYNPTQCRFDHHQNGFNQFFGHGFTTKLSTAGLVYKVNESSP